VHTSQVEYDCSLVVVGWLVGWLIGGWLADLVGWCVTRQLGVAGPVMTSSKSEPTDYLQNMKCYWRVKVDNIDQEFVSLVG
jgi:hypothetical protein